MRVDHTTYLSPFTWRYASDEMRQVFSDIHRRQLWRRIWVALARAQASVGLATPEQLADIEAHAEDIDLDTALEIEKVTRHDVMAEIKTFAGQCKIGGGVIHLGATSMDVVDNADALRQIEALDLVLTRLAELIRAFADLVERHAETPVMGYTHLQPAEPTTLGYRFAQTLQDLLVDWEEIRRVRANLKGKGLKGAVGTLASFAQLLAGTGVSAGELERRVLADLGLDAFPVATQTYPRKQDWLVLNALTGLAGTLYRFAFDLRVPTIPGLRRTVRAVRSGAGGVVGHAVQAQPHHRRKDRQPGPLSGRTAQCRLAQRRPQPARTHARRLRQPPQPYPRSLPDHR